MVLRLLISVKAVISLFFHFNHVSEPAPWLYQGHSQVKVMVLWT